MDGAEDQVPGLRGGKGGLNGLQIPHLPHQNHVRVLPEGGPQPGGKAPGIPAHLPLVDDAAFGGVDVFNGVLQGEDVLLLPLVNPLQDGRQGGGFSGAGLPGDEHQALVIGGKIRHHRRQPQLLQLRNGLLQQADGGGPGSLLPEEVDPAAHPGDGDGQICLPHHVRLSEIRSRQLPGQGGAVLLGEGDGIHLPDAAIHPVAGAQSPHQMDVAGPVRQGLGYQSFYHHSLFSLLSDNR